MNYSFSVMYKNEEVSRVLISDSGKNTCIERLTDCFYKQPFLNKKNDIFYVYDFLKSRCYEDNRADLEQILKQAHLTSNNPWEWIQITHGVTYDDFLWIRFPGEHLRWEDIKLR